ncbi:peptidase M24 [Porphyromonas macacae]|uniref:M24 family metallopeptidase n=1 Tax=Porphyromonas macacae TaxID=28115 RepID=UPI00052C7865|nr:Xaa-Pro peptidase family protein [Porphyromonas macacae]KGN99948.1 peptidase M24 [Porphyromonas macacae]
MTHEICLNEYEIRAKKVQEMMKHQGVDGLLIASEVNLLYLTGKIFMGAVYIPSEGSIIKFIRRPLSLSSDASFGGYVIRKIEQIRELLAEQVASPERNVKIGLELGELPYSEITRQQNIFDSDDFIDATALMRQVRMVKTNNEIEEIKLIANIHVSLMQKIPAIYRKGMTDRDFQIEIEREMRKMGSIGIFRSFGISMNIFMGSVLTGDNADAPSPYDFALGGAGVCALPIGANGSEIKKGQSIMIDMAGNFGSYITDITRTYSLGKLPQQAYELHELSRTMHREIMQKARPGVSCADIYNMSLERVQKAGAQDFFMGHTQRAQFVGHGFGLHINEMPVLTGRSKDVLQPGMTIAYEPKFVIPGVGAVGVENSYLITDKGVELLTELNEEIIDIDK